MKIVSPRLLHKMSTDFPTAAVGSSQAPTATVEKSHGASNTKIPTPPNRKAKYKVWCTSLTVNLQGLALTKHTLRNHFEPARAAAAIAHPEKADEIKEMWFYDLRAKAADDTADDHGDQAAADLLGHKNVATTRRHYLRRGKKVGPTR
jgi:integrase